MCATVDETCAPIELNQLDADHRVAVVLQPVVALLAAVYAAAHVHQFARIQGAQREPPTR